MKVINQANLRPGRAPFAAADSAYRINYSQSLLRLSSMAAVALLVVGCGSSSSDSDDTDSSPETPVGEAACPTVTQTLAFDESTDGDLSNDPANPTARSLAAGANVVDFVTGAEDGQDYLTVRLEPCMTLDSVFVQSYQGTDNDEVGALLLQRGEFLTVTPDTVANNIDQLLGFAHFGVGTIGSDVLALAGTASNVEGFTTPLAADDYTFWLNQTGPQATYQLVF